MDTHRDVHGRFVGRSDELAILTRLRLESHRYGRLVLIAGEPGIGKSRLVNEFLHEAPRGRAVVGVGRALEHVRSPFLPWVSALEAVSPPAARAVRPNGPGFDDKLAMYGKVVEALRESARRRATMLVLEDLHWADAGSVDLLHVLAAEMHLLRRLLVVCTVRSAEAGDAISSLFTNPHVSVLQLRPLASKDCLDLVRSLLHTNDTVRSRIDRIVALSGGNPFFASELCKNTNSGDIPLTLSSAIEARIAPLQRAELDALEAASVLGEEFDLRLLADVAQCSPAAVAKRLEPAERAGIVVGETDGSFRFAHALTRAILASHLTSAERIELHSRAARALESRRRFDAFGFAQLAYHHARAHDREKAYAYQMRAGGLAYTVHAYADAATFFADAAACAEPGSLERAGALAREGDALLRTSSLEDAERAYIAAIEIYRAAGSIEEAARLYQSLARSLFNQDRVRDALTLIEYATAELNGLPAELKNDLQLHAAHYGADLSPDAGMQWLSRIDEQAISGTRSGGSYYAIGATIHATRGDLEAWERAVASFQENASIAHPDGQYVGHFGNLAASALFLGVPATPLYEQCFALARTLKMDVYEAAFASHAAFERWLHGDDESFLRYARFAAAHDAPIPALHSYVLLNALLRDPAALPDLREVEAIVAGGRNEFFGPLVGVLARRLARSGNTRAAHRILDVAAERLEHPYAAWETVTAMAEFGSAAARDRAELLLRPYHEASAPAFAATAAMVRALHARRDGGTTDLDRAASRAKELYARMGWIHHERRARDLGAPQTDQRFSSRELQIAQLLQQGRSNRAMAAELFISEKTVEKHLARLYEKLQVNNRAAAVRALTQITPEE